MKLLLLIVAAFAAANAASVGVDKKDVTVGGEEASPRWGHHSSYCCYKIKKELEERMDKENVAVETSFLETKRSIKSNMDRVVKMEKRLEQQEDFDFKAIQGEVLALTTVIGDVEGEVKDLKGVENKHHQHLVNEINQVEKQIGKVEGGIELEIQNLNSSVGDLFIHLHATQSGLDVAGNDISVLQNQTTEIDGQLHHIGEMTIKAFADVDALIANVSSVAAAASAQGDDNSASIGSLVHKTRSAEGKIQMLVAKADATTESIGNLTTDLHSAVEKVDIHLATQDKEIHSLKDGQVSLESAVNALEAESGSNSSSIRVNARAISRLQWLVNQQGETIATNANNILEVRGQLKQLGESVEALRLHLKQHREDIVEEMKKLTAAIAN